MKTRENSWHCCAFVGSFTTQKWPSWNCLPRSPTLLGRCELLFFLSLWPCKKTYVTPTILYINGFIPKKQHHHSGWSRFICLLSRHFFKDNQLELAPTRCTCVGSLPPQPHPQVASLLVILSLVLMAPRPGALATPEVVEAFGQAAPVLGYPAPPFSRWLLPGLAGGNLATKNLAFFFGKHYGNIFFLGGDEHAKHGKPFFLNFLFG